MLRRPRRNRQSETIRAMARETTLGLSNLIQPLFLVSGSGCREEIHSLPGNFRLSEDELLKEVEACMVLGLRNFILFPAIPSGLKDKTATYSYNPDNFYLQTASRLKKAFPEICLISDVAMDPYNVDGHDGYVAAGKIQNDATLPILAKMAVAQAEAGFDMLGP